MPTETVAGAGDSWVIFLIGGFFLWVAMVLLALYVAQQKGRSEGEAFMISALFGPFGVLIVALLPTLPGKSRTLAEALEGKSKPQSAYRNPTDEEWRDWIDWTGVKTEEQEKAAKKAAYLKYLTAFGPKPTEVEIRPDGKIGCTCVCGRPQALMRDHAGKVVACTGCKIHFVAPSVT